MKIASHILQKIILLILIQVCFYSQYVGIILLPFSLSSRSRSSHQKCSTKSCSRDLKARWIWTNFEMVVEGRWNQKQKSFHRNYNDIFFTNISLIFSSSVKVEIRENVLTRQTFPNLLKSVPWAEFDPRAKLWLFILLDCRKMSFLYLKGKLTLLEKTSKWN